MYFLGRAPEYWVLCNCDIICDIPQTLLMIFALPFTVSEVANLFDIVTYYRP